MATQNPLWSTVGRKAVTALTGLAFFIFLIGHLAGNLLILVSAEAYNEYSHKLISLGGLLYVAEAILVIVFVGHAVFAISVTIRNRRARSHRYQVSGKQGPPSRMNSSSRTMIWTGITLFVFTVLHLITFKYGPDQDQGYVATVNGEQVRDLHRLVIEVFQEPVYVIWYVAAMVLLGFHLRHGIWSAFQSLGAYHPRYTPVIYTLGVLFAVVLGFGFLVIPVWIYLGGGV